MLYMTAADALIAVWDDKAQLVVLAADHRDPRGRQRRQPAHAAAGRLDAADRDPAVPGAPVRAHRAQRLDRQDAPAVLRDRQDRLEDTNNAGLTRSFSSLSQAIDEIVDARVWSGIHFRTADDQGQRIGRAVARYRQTRYFRPE